MVAQTAASLALLLITGFLVIGHRRISDVDVGFNARNLHLISLDPVRDGYTGEQAALFFHRLLDRMRNRAAIQGASSADAAPMTMIGKPGVPVLADTATGSKSMHSARKYVVGDDFFKTMDIPILRGRDFRKEDEQNDASAVIVSEKLAKECWPGGDALGKRIEIGNEDVPGFTVGTGTPRGMARMPRAGRLLEVVGVAKDIRDGLNMVAADAPAVVYLPLRQADYNRSFLQGITLLLRTSPGAEAGDIVRREVSAIDERVTPFNIRRMPEQIEELMFPVKVALWTYGCIGITGLILACVGLAGVTSYTVSRRRREIGIRVALGAGEADVLGLVMKESAALVLVGTAIGLCWAWAAIRVLSGLMAVIARTAGTSTSDPALLAGAPLLLAVLALVTCYFPARKSIRIDPAVALRQD
jgi:putative ABC transport system permease protein